MPEHQRVVNTLKWVDPAGAPVEHDYAGVLPRRNLWERLRESRIEPISVQPGDFRGTPLTRVLYRGARFEGIWDIDDLVSATVQLAETPGRLIFTYVPHVDFAGHVHGQDSTEFAEAMKLADRVWDELRRRLPPGASLIGTADHGLIDYDEGDKHLIREPSFDTMRFAGDPRGLHLWGNRATVEELAQVTGGELLEPASLLGPEPTDEFTRRTGDHLLLAPPGKLLLPPRLRQTPPRLSRWPGRRRTRNPPPHRLALPALHSAKPVGTRTYLHSAGVEITFALRP